MPEDTDEQIADSTIITDDLLEDEHPPIEQKISVKTIPPQQKGVYIVKKGDTLYAIAKKTNVSINTLCKINNIKQESILQIGQKLKLGTN
jgi:LysM repeat protein